MKEILDEYTRGYLQADKDSANQHVEIQFDKVTEAIERIVILYANYTGRESKHRAAFRHDVTKVLVGAFASSTPDQGILKQKSIIKP